MIGALRHEATPKRVSKIEDSRMLHVLADSCSFACISTHDACKTKRRVHSWHAALFSG